jgi:hypothetical protein
MALISYLTDHSTLVVASPPLSLLPLAMTLRLLLLDHPGQAVEAILFE